jgi:hypothetical protein
VVPYRDAVVVTRTDFAKWASFAERIVRKMLASSNKAVESFAGRKNITLDQTRKKALWFLLWCD